MNMLMTLEHIIYEIVFTSLYMSLSINLSKTLKGIHRASDRKVFCGAMRNMIVIDKNGAIYPCQRFVGNTSYKVGDIHSKVDMKKYNEIVTGEFYLNLREDCVNCWAKTLCGGGCPNEDLGKTGFVNRPIKEYCEINKYYINQVLERYLNLSKEERKELFDNI